MKPRTQASLQEIRVLRRRASERLLQKPGVVSIGKVRVGPGAYRLAVHLISEDARKDLPTTIDGHAIEYVVSGPVELWVAG